MSAADWQFVLNESSVNFLLGCKARERDALIEALQRLTSDPYKQGEFETRDSTGRKIQVKVVRKFLISYWQDHYVKELRVIYIERI